MANRATRRSLVGKKLVSMSDGALTWNGSPIANIGPVAELWAQSPAIQFDPSLYFEIFEDFMDPDTSAISARHVWTAVNDGTTGTPVYQDAAGGIFNVVTSAADNDYSAYSSFHEPFKFAAGKELWFEARFKLSLIHI